VQTIAEKKSVSLISLEPTTTQKSSTDPTSAHFPNNNIIHRGSCFHWDESGPSKPAENGHVDLEAKEIESRDITEAGEAVRGRPRGC
jgi:hypothetical protein